jgi:hypothetical protein
MMRPNIRRIFLALAVAACSASAVAGLKSASDVIISDTYGWAYGDAGHVYRTSDRTQEITCSANGASGSCYARDLNGVFRSCYSSEARWVRAMSALKGDSYVVFYWDANGYCTYVGVQNDSMADRK